ncbi:putative protein kinase, partial [Nicotiana attenuata]
SPYISTSVKEESQGVQREVELLRKYYQLRLRLTGNFGQKALVGEGSYSCVFCAKWSNGQQAAIKNLDTSSSPEPDSDFAAQLSMISRLKHEHFMTLMGYCLEGNNHILVYEFATKGSLHDVLHGTKGVQGAEPGPVLTWNQRVKIAYGAAKGLEYLHEKVQPPIVHRDVRSRIKHIVIQIKFERFYAPLILK